MIKITFLFCFLVLVTACVKETVPTPSSGLQYYIDQNSSLAIDDLIACAAGTQTSFLGSTEFPVAVFLYPESGANEFRYFETSSIDTDPSDFNNYEEKNYLLTDVFNGALKKFDHPPLNDERWGIVTFKTEDKLHICNPIRLKAAISPTEDITTAAVITENGVTPSFDWSAAINSNNVIYFSVVSEANNDFISGTYTSDAFWTFYDLSNVILNVTTNTNPMLAPNVTYNYTMMGVSEDNWVHSLVMRSFVTN